MPDSGPFTATCDRMRTVAWLAAAPGERPKWIAPAARSVLAPNRDPPRSLPSARPWRTRHAEAQSAERHRGSAGPPCALRTFASSRARAARQLGTVLQVQLSLEHCCASCCRGHYFHDTPQAWGDQGTSGLACSVNAPPSLYATTVHVSRWRRSERVTVCRQDRPTTCVGTPLGLTQVHAAA
jgi:hypothetical protein